MELTLLPVACIADKSFRDLRAVQAKELEPARIPVRPGQDCGVSPDKLIGLSKPYALVSAGRIPVPGVPPHAKAEL